MRALCFIVLLGGCGSSVEAGGQGGGAVASTSAQVGSSSTGIGGAGGTSVAGGSGGAGGEPAELCTTLWERTFGGPGSDYGQQLLLSDGSLLLAGSFQESIDFGLGPLTAMGEIDMFLVKLDGSGDALWNKSFTTMEVALGYPLDHDAQGNLFVGGSFSGTLDLGGGPLASTVTGFERDVFLAKLDTTGNHLWSKRLGAPGCSPSSCGITAAVTQTGELLVTVVGGGTLDFGGGPLTSAGFTDVFLALLDAAGNHLWSERYGDAGIEWANVSRSSDGQLWLYGSFEGTFTLGNLTLTSGGSYDGFLAKLDAGGSIAWLEQFAGGGDAMVLDLETRGSYLTVTGLFDSDMTVGTQQLTSASKEDVFVATLDHDGSIVSAWSFGGDSSQSGLGVTQTMAGHVLVGGQFNEHFELAGRQTQSAGWTDAFWAAFEESGAPLGACTYGTTGLQLIDDLDAAGDGIFFTAIFEDAIDFGNGPLTSAGEIDIAVGKLAVPAP